MQDAVIERIKASWPLSRFFEEVCAVEFTRTGEGFSGKCPFHEDTSPSLQINTKKQVWHCFGCDKGGDLLNAIEYHLGIPFQEAVEWAADRLGIETKPAAKGKVKLALAQAVNEYHHRLRQNPPALYLVTLPEGRRGLTMETIARFRIGWDGEYYSIPITTPAGTVSNLKMVHPDNDHQPRMKFFVRGKAKEWFPAEAFKEHSEVIAVGGEWDALRMQQEGFSNAVCWLTGESGLTADTAAEAKGKRITLLLDADEPGRAASRKCGMMLTQAGATVLTVDWMQGEWGKDATDWLRTSGAETLKGLLQEAQPPAGGTARMGGCIYWEAEDGYYRQYEGKEASIRITDFIIRYQTIWKPHGGSDPPAIEGTIFKGTQRIPFYFKTDDMADSRKFRQELMRLSPQLSFSVAHLSELSAVLAELNAACPIYESVMGPGYVGDTFITPSVIVRGGQCIPNNGEIHVVNDSPVVMAYALAMPPQNRKDAINALMALLSVHDYKASIAGLAHCVLAPTMKYMGATPYTLYITGPTGVGKTMLAKCLMNLWMDLDPMAAEHGKVLSAHSTPNSLQRIG